MPGRAGRRIAEHRRYACQPLSCASSERRGNRCADGHIYSRRSRPSRNARRAWESYLSDGEGVDSFRIIIPYSADNEFLQEFERTFIILDEVLACYGGDPEKVHVAGVSNGGLAAFALMLQRPERFATLLGAPGEFPEMDPARWGKVLAGRAVFNGVGELDDAWKPEVKETHDALLSAGIDSNYGEFPGQGHTAKEGFDKSVLFDFWIKRS